MYRRVVTQDGVTVMNKELYDNLQDGIDELKSSQFLEVVGDGSTICDSSKKGGLLLNKLFGKSMQKTTKGNQLITYPYAETTKTSKGITWTDNGDGSVTVNGTSTGESYFSLRATSSDVIDGQYFLSGGASNVSLYTKGNNEETRFDNGKGVSLPDGYGFISLYVKNGTTVNNVTIYPMLNIGTEALPYEQYTGGIASPSPTYPQEIKNVGEDKQVDVSVYGNNLLELVPNNNTEAINGLNISFEKDRLYVSGIVNAVWSNLTGYTTTIFPSGTYVASVESTYDFTVGMKCRNSKGKVLASNKITKGKKTVEFTINEPFVMGEVFVESLTSGKIYSFEVKMQVSLKKELPYIPYSKPQTLTIPLLDSLKGLKTIDSSVSNFTDENGQMWVCDEVDLERGVYVQRIKELVLKGTESWEISGSYFTLNLGELGSVVSDTQMCNYLGSGNSFSGLNHEIHVFNSTSNNRAQLALHYSSSINTVSDLKTILAGRYSSGTPVKVYYALATPIETPIDQSEMAKILGLQSYDNVTTIIGIEDVGISVEIPTTDGAGIAGLALNIAKQTEMRYAVLTATVE